MRSFGVLSALVVALLASSSARAQGYGYPYGPIGYPGYPAAGGYGIRSGPLTNYGFGNGVRGTGIQAGGFNYYRDNAGNTISGVGSGNFRYYQYRQTPPSKSAFAFPRVGF